MKQTFFIFCIVFFSLLSTVQAQAPLVYLNNKIKSGWYFGMGLHQPRGITKALPTGENGDLAFMRGEDGLGLSTGFVMDLGTILYFGNNNKKRNFRTGLDVDVRAAFIQSDYNSFFINGDEISGYLHFENPDVGAGLGFVFSLNPVGDLIVDLTAKIRGDYANLPVVNYSRTYEDAFGWEETDYLSFEPYDSYETYVLSIGTGLGLRLKYGRFVLATQWTNHRINENYYGAWGEDYFRFSKKFVDVTVGMQF